MGAEDGGVGRDRRDRREAGRDERRREPCLDRGEERPRVAEFGGARKTDGDRGISIRDRVHAKKEILRRFERELACGERRVEREPLEKRRAQPLDLPFGRDRVGDGARGGTEADGLGRERCARPHARRRRFARPRAETRRVAGDFRGADRAERLIKVRGRGGRAGGLRGSIRRARMRGVVREREREREHEREHEHERSRASEGRLAAHHRAPPNATDR